MCGTTEQVKNLIFFVNSSYVFASGTQFTNRPIRPHQPKIRFNRNRSNWWWLTDGIR